MQAYYIKFLPKIQCFYRICPENFPEIFIAFLSFFVAANGNRPAGGVFFGILQNFFPIPYDFL